MHIDNLTFGIEIEMTGLTRISALNSLYDVLSEAIGVVATSENKVITIDNRTWKIVRDSSITPALPIDSVSANGYITLSHVDRALDLFKTARVEFVSPKCTMKDWPILRQILKAFRDNGATVNESCGHIHVNATNLDGDFLHKLGYVTMTYEPILYRILSVAPKRKKDYCRPMQPYLKRYLTRYAKNSMRYGTTQNLKDTWNSRYMHKRRYHGLNLENVLNPSNKHTVEFRYFNSTLHAGKIRSYLNLVFALLNKANKIQCIQDVKCRSYTKPTHEQLEKWLYFMELTDDTNVYKHLINGFTQDNYFQ